MFIVEPKYPVPPVLNTQDLTALAKKLGLPEDERLTYIEMLVAKQSAGSACGGVS